MPKDKLGFDPDNEKEISTVVYTEHFEKAFLDASMSFYQAKSREFFENSEGNFTKYMEDTKQLIEAEEGRVRRYLLEPTLSKVKALLNQAFVISRKADFYEAFSSLLQLRNGEADANAIGLAYSLLNRVKGGKNNKSNSGNSEEDANILSPLFGIFERHVESEGLKRIDEIKDDAARSSDVFIFTVLKLHDLVMNRIVAHQLQGNPQLKESAEIAFKKFVNTNSFTGRKDPHSAHRSAFSASLSQGSIPPYLAKNRAGVNAAAPQALATFCDNILRKTQDSATSRESVEERLNDVVTVFSYINDKDVFGMLCEKFLSKRLIGGNTAGVETEGVFVEKLKAVQGQDFVKKMEVMINDINSNAETNEKFYEYCKEKNFPLNCKKKKKSKHSLFFVHSFIHSLMLPQFRSHNSR